MPKHTDTYARAYEACGSVFTELARFPTIDLIRERIGVNSPTVIKRAITDWTLAFAEQAREKQGRPDLPHALLETAERLWALALREARTQFDRERHTWTEDKTALADRLATAEQARETLARDFEAYRTAATTARDEHTATRLRLQQQLDAERAGRATAEQALAEARAELGILAATLATERAQFAQRQQDWEARLAGEHRWHLQRIAEEQTRLEAQRQRELAQRDRELARLALERETLGTRLRAAQEQQAEGRGRQRALEDQLAAARNTLAEREQALAEANQAWAAVRTQLQAAAPARAAARPRAEPPPAPAGETRRAPAQSPRPRRASRTPKNGSSE
jgi:chromosome segregation ATPase